MATIKNHDIMKRPYKYELMPYAEMKQRGLRKGVCPKCGKQRLSHYVNVETRELAGDEFGMCERRIECGYNPVSYTHLTLPTIYSV